MTDAAHAEMFAALCKEVGFCLHPKGEKRVLEALPWLWLGLISW